MTAQAAQIVCRGRLHRLALRYMAVDRRFSRSRPRAPRIHAHALFHLVLYTRGYDSIVVDRRSVPVGPATLVVVSPGSPHDIQGTRPGLIEYSEITFAYVAADGGRLKADFDAVVSALFGQSISTPPMPVSLESFDADRVRARFLRLITLLEFPSPLSQAAISLELMSLFAMLARDWVKADPGDVFAATGPAAVVCARQFLDHHYQEPLRVRDVAQEVGVSEEHLSRLFTKYMGLSLMRYVRQRRLDAAATMLADTSLPVGTIADEVGFSDVYHFSHAFKNATGCSPRAYRIREAAVNATWGAADEPNT